MNTRYFNMDDFMALKEDDRQIVLDWAENHDLIELNITLVSENITGDGLVISGLGKDYDPEQTLSQYDHKEVARLKEDDFPWDVLDRIQPKVENS